MSKALVAACFLLLYLGNSAAANDPEQAMNLLTRTRIRFSHPDNGVVYVYLMDGGNYMMRQNNPRTGAAMGDGGRWWINEQMELCVTAINQPSFAGCGALSFDGNRARWDHEFFDGLIGIADFKTWQN